MLIFHGGDACLVSGIALLQVACEKVIQTIPRLATQEPTEQESQQPVDRVIVERALIHMRKERVPSKIKRDGVQ